MTLESDNIDYEDIESISNKIITIHPIVTYLIKQLLLYFMMILYGGRDSGKTVAMIHLLLMLCLTGNHKIAVFRAEQSQLEKESIKAMIENVIYRLGLHPFCRRIGKRIMIGNKIEININGFSSIIVFDFIANNPEKLRGSYDGFDILVFEELHQFPKRVLEVAIPTLERAPHHPHLLGTCNLEEQNTYAYELLKMGGLENEEKGWQHMIQELYNGDASQAAYPHFGKGIEMLYDTNPYLTKFARNRIVAMKHANYEEYLVIYRNHPRTLRDEIIIRNWKLLPEPLNVHFDESGDTWLKQQEFRMLNQDRETKLLTVPTVVTINETMLCPAKYGQDYGTNHYFINVEAFYFIAPMFDETEQKVVDKKFIYIHRIVMETHLDNMEITPRILQRMPEQIKYSKLTYGDSARKDMINSISNGFLGVYPRINVRSCFKYTDESGTRGSKGAILDGIGFLKSAIILVNPQCQYDVNTGEYHAKDVIFQLKNYRWTKNKNTEKITDDPVKADDDLLDALRYAFEDTIQEQYTLTTYSDEFWNAQREGIQNAESYF